jgi:hypothetical protein
MEGSARALCQAKLFAHSVEQSCSHTVSNTAVPTQSRTQLFPHCPTLLLAHSAEDNCLVAGWLSHTQASLVPVCVCFSMVVQSGDTPLRVRTAAASVTSDLCGAVPEVIAGALPQLMPGLALLAAAGDVSCNEHRAL